MGLLPDGERRQPPHATIQGSAATTRALCATEAPFGGVGIQELGFGVRGLPFGFEMNPLPHPAPRNMRRTHPAVYEMCVRFYEALGQLGQAEPASG